MYVYNIYIYILYLYNGSSKTFKSIIMHAYKTLNIAAAQGSRRRPRPDSSAPPRLAVDIPTATVG